MDNSNFKIKELQLLNIADNSLSPEKKYRRIFDKSELTAITAELKLYNKKFDEEDWESKVEFFIWFNSDTEKMILDTYETTLGALAIENIVSLKYTFEPYDEDEWEPGSYSLELWIDDEKAESIDFTLINEGTLSNDENPYFEVFGLKLFEDTDVPEPKKV
jgi:hypothetical protein